MLSPRIRRYLRLQQLFASLAGLCFGLLFSVISNQLTEERWSGLLPWVLVVAVAAALASLILLLRERIGIDVAIRSPITIRLPEEARRHARRGFVGFVPLYTPKPGTAAASLPPEERLKAATALDFDRLQPEESNLWPTIKAILSHSSKLEHCWLVATEGRNRAGSLPYARFLAEYLRQRYGLTCLFHYGEEHTIALDDDPLVLGKTYDKIRAVFQEARTKQIPPQEMVADITTGFRSMTLGLILACLDKDQDIEFVGTRYDEAGRPVGDLFPIIFSFEPLVQSE